MKKLVTKASIILFLFIFIISSAWNVFAKDTTDYFRFVASKDEVCENDEVRMEIDANDVDLKENIAGFRLNVKFDSTKLTLKRVDTSSQIQNGTFRYHINGDSMTGIYVCDGKSAPKLTGVCMTLVFRVNQDAVTGETSVSAQIDQIVNWSADQLSSVSSLTSIFTLKPIFTREATLRKLVPDHGTLEPAFDPYMLEYTLNVDAQVDQILFDLEAADNGTARVNRKNLGKQGSATQFIVTVVSADKKNQSQYIINVNRLEKEKAQSIGSGKSSSSKTAGKSKNDSTTGKHGNDDGNDDNGANGNVETVFYGNRNLYIVGNQMPAYVMYMILGGAAILIICIISAIVISVRKKKR